MITFSKFGNHGRLGNQLFQYAAMLGLADKLRTKLCLPAWEYADYFQGEHPKELPSAVNVIPVNELMFTHDPTYIERLRKIIDNGVTPDCFGYYQTEKYWEQSRPLVRNTLTFRPEVLDQIRRKYWRSFANHKKVIAIHIRRGDYVDNDNYALLPITYFISALFKFPDWRKHSIIVFGDDIPFCKVHFDCLPNVQFAEGNSPIDDLALMSMCHHFIISNSSFAWWGAYLGQKNGTRVIRPVKHFEGKLKAKNPIKDFYPAHWEQHEAELIDLSDVTFTIPVAYDSKDRKKNLDLCVCLLQHNFITNIIVGEQGGNQFAYMAEHTDYVQFKYKDFHRTRMLNDMARRAETEFIANWDADIIVPPLQLYEAVELLRHGAQMVYPYKWAFARIPRQPWFEQIERRLDIGIVGDKKFEGMNNSDAVSFGGAVIFNGRSFFAGGGENEHFISFGPEDAERFYRFTHLGFTVKRTPGTLYHINHYVGPNSSNRHPHVKRNREEWEHIQAMSKAELRNYVAAWPWAKQQTTHTQ